ncbi:hypothetical protein NEOLEDRAFT_834977 [Neolentinus lepideus HHB14362 ss-1]|uniref:Uncharacterized protein n=1 Tax=Neolentinus lepideus HHB14362 ss-1 TaxID=1314782 RepID=A0A165P834_9AGAM|nr:hypothetical protein NEOLEDRAFT_834977 [Neolentinus lepideus HHB14362 ss-1]
MNSLQELHTPKRTSIPQLLNPVAPTVNSTSFADPAQFSPFNATAHPINQHSAHAYRAPSESGSSYSLRAANWEQAQQNVEEESLERPRAQSVHGPPQERSQRVDGPQMTFGMVQWPQPPGNLPAEAQATYGPPVPQPMFSDERTRE